MPIIKKHQTLLDFATQHCGAGAGIFDTANRQGISITDEVAPGTELQVTILDVKVIKAFSLLGLDIATGASQAGLSIITGGIGYMKIQESFKVS